MDKVIILSVALALVVGGSILFGWTLHEWHNRPRYRRKTNRH